MGATNTYTHKDTGRVIAAADGSYLDGVIRDSGAYETGGELATDVPAYGADAGGELREEHDGGWVTAPGVAPEAVTAASFMRPTADGGLKPANTVGAATGSTTPPADDEDQADTVVLDPALKAKAYEVDTVEGINGYLDENPGDAGAVLAYEAANRNRTGIVDGRHKAATPPAV